MAIITGILKWLFSGVWNAVGSYFQSKDTTTTTEGAVEQAESSARAQIVSAGMNHGWFVCLLVMLALPVAVYEWKCYVWDMVLGLGSTPEIKGILADWGSTIITGIFGYGSVSMIVRGFKS